MSNEQPAPGDNPPRPSERAAELQGLIDAGIRGGLDPDSAKRRAVKMLALSEGSYLEPLHRYLFVSLDGKTECFESSEATWWIGKVEALKGQTLWRTEDDRWLLDAAEDPEGWLRDDYAQAEHDAAQRRPMQEVSREKARWWLTANNEKSLPPGMPPALNDPDSFDGGQATPLARPAPSVSPFPCNKAELLCALGKHRTHANYLEQMAATGALELTDAPNPVGTRRYLARFADPAEHARIVALIERERRSRIRPR